MLENTICHLLGHNAVNEDMQYLHWDLQVTAIYNAANSDIFVKKEGNRTISFTLIRRLAMMPSLVQVAAGTKEATDNGGNNGHKE